MIQNALKPLLIRMPNWIGDCMMALPTLHYLEKKGLTLTLVGKNWLKPLFADSWPVIAISQTDTDHISAIKKHASKDMLLLTNSFSSAWLAKKAGKKAIGYRGDYRSWLLSKKYSAYANLHESNHFLKLAQRYLNDVLSQDPLKAYALPNKASKHIQSVQKNVLEKYPILNEKFILICPFSVGTNKAGQSKVWPFWSLLIEKIHKKRPDLNMIYCPNAGEMLSLHTTSDKNNFITPLHHIALNDYFAIMQLATLVIGNDTGPMHMASCVNSKTVTLFGATDPKRTSPILGQFLGKYGEWPSVDEVMASLSL
jgi:heptosyltransferase-2